MATLRQQRLAVVRQLEETSREAKRVRRNNANALRRNSALTPARVSLGPRKQLLRMLRVCQGDYGAAVTCIDHASHPPAWAGLPQEQKQELLQAIEAQHHAAEVDEWSSPTIAANTHALRYLWRLRAEHGAALWVEHINRTRGVAPSSARVFEQFRRHAQGAPPGVREHLLRPRTANAKRKWAGRWRHTWKGQLGTLAFGDVDDPVHFQAKAFS